MTSSPVGATVTDWSAGSGSASTTVTVDLYGEYEFTWTEANGTCNDAETITITFNEAPILSFPLTETICSDVAANRSLSITNAVPGTTYEWGIPTNTGGMTGGTAGAGLSTGPITDIFINLTGSPQTATFSVIPTSGAGCAGSATDVVITVNPLPLTTEISGEESLCLGAANVIYEVTSTGGSTYAWTVPGSGILTKDFDNNIYFIHTTAASAGGPENVQVIETNSFLCVGPAKTIPVTVSNSITGEIITGSEDVCVEASGIKYSVTDNAGSSYSWTTPPGVSITSDPTANEINVAFGLVVSDDFSVVETNTSGCITIHSPLTVTVNPLPIIYNLTAPNYYCFGDAGVTVSLSNSEVGADYQLYKDGNPEGGVVAGTASALSWNNMLAGTYTVEAVFTTGSGCAEYMNGNPTVTENDEITVSDITTSTSADGSYNINCNGAFDGSFNLTVAGGTIPYTYSIDGGLIYQSNNNFASLGAGDYTINIRDSKSCIIDSTISLTEPLVLTAGSIGVNDTICYGDDPVPLTELTSATGGPDTYSYQWMKSQSEAGQWTNISGANDADYDPDPIASTSYYKREVISGTCTPEYSNTVVVWVNAMPTAILTGGEAICPTETSILNIELNSGTGPFEIDLENHATLSNYVSGTDIPVNPAETTTYSLLRVIDANGCISDTTSGNLSGTATVVVQEIVGITSQPVNSEVCELYSTSFSVGTSGDGVSIQWEVNDGSGWQKISDGENYTGSGLETLSVYSVDSTMNGYQYHAVVSGTCGTPIATDEPELIVKTNPVITLQSEDTIICQDNSAIFNVNAEGSGLNYQWQYSSTGVYQNLVNNDAYSGVNTAELTVTDDGAIYNGYSYRVRVSGTCNPPVNSEEVHLNVNANPVISGDPSGSEICEGGNTSFISGATGSDMLYQWEESSDNGNSWNALIEGENYGGVNTSSLSIIDALVSLNNNQYRLSVSNPCVEIKSGAAILIVNANPTAEITGDGRFPIVCGGADLNLDANANGGTGIYTDHLWTGDVNYLNTTTEEQVKFKTLISGSFELVYTVTDSKSCKGSASVQIENDRPNAQFTSDAEPTCGDLTVNFVNNTSGAVGYEWNFDDGGPLETTLHAVHDFDNFDPTVRYFNIELVATSANTCRDTAYQIITVYPKVDADFTLEPEEACQPVNALMTALPGASRYTWDFGDGEQDPDGGYFVVHSFQNTGAEPRTYSISLTTESYYGCISTLTKDITVNPIPLPRFDVAPYLQTFPDATVTITNLVTQGNWEYLYEFGDGNTSNSAEPIHTYSEYGTFIVVQKVIFGDCIDSVGQSVIISPPKPVASFNLPTNGCTPHFIQFENTSTDANSFVWEFGDGSISTKRNPFYTYFEEGTFSITLTVSGPGGSDVHKESIEIWAMPNLFFSNVPDSVYINDKPVKFFNYSRDATYYAWNFGDINEEWTNGALAESPENISEEFEPSHIYEFVGSKDVLLVGWNEFCKDTLFKKDAVYVSPAGALLFPNVFRPNPGGGSGGYYDPNNPTTVNTIFFPGVIDQVLEYDLYIYNRWGEMIFHSQEVNHGWDGYVKERLAKQGVYIWKVKGKYTNGKNFVEEGDVTLLH